MEWGMGAVGWSRDVARTTRLHDIATARNGKVKFSNLINYGYETKADMAIPMTKDLLLEFFRKRSKPSKNSGVA